MCGEVTGQAVRSVTDLGDNWAKIEADALKPQGLGLQGMGASLYMKRRGLVGGAVSGAGAPPGFSSAGLGRSPGGEMAIRCSILAWEMPWTDKPGGYCQVHGGLQRAEHH